MLKKVLMFLVCIIFLSSLVVAQGEKITISLTQGSESISPGDSITFIIKLQDSNNNPLNNEVNVIFEDSIRNQKINQKIKSNTPTDIKIDKEGLSGVWTIIANYNEVSARTSFIVEENEIATFEIIDDKLTITNIGNTKYSKTIHVFIGDGLKELRPEIEIGEKRTFRLIAPEGIYNVRVAVDQETKLNQDNVALTGNVVEVLDERASQRTGLTGGIKPEEDQGFSYDYLKKNKFTYLFVSVIFVAAVVLTVGRRIKTK